MSNSATVSALLQQGQHDKALTLVRQLLRQSPEDAMLWQLRGLVHLLKGEPGQAQEPLRRSLALAAGNTRTLALLAVSHAQDGQPEQALPYMERAVALEPGNAMLWYDLSKLEFEAGLADRAFASVERALALNPQLAHAWLNHGNLLREQGQVDKALQSLQRALALAPQDVAVRHALGEALLQARRMNDALACHSGTVQLKPDHTASWLSLGNVHFFMGQFERAVQAYQRATVLDPQQAAPWIGLGNALGRQGRFDQAVPALRRGVELNGAKGEFVHDLVLTLQRVAQWDVLAPLWPQTLAGSAEADVAIGAPFVMLSHPQATPADLLRSARACVDGVRRKLPRPATAWAPPATPPQRLRVAYVSADFRDHPMAYLMAGVFESHDRQRFEVIGVDISAHALPDSATRQRLMAGFDRFITVGHLSDEALANELRALDIHILVDLMGLTSGTRIGALLQRPAPIQVNYLGFPGTCGAPELDYIIGDRWVSPEGSAADFAEHIVRMPHSFQANDRLRAIGPTPTRASLGLPEEAFVFCCLNNAYKVLPRMFDIWMRLLAAVPGSVLWLVEETELGTRNLRSHAQARGVDPARLVFAKRKAQPDYLAQYRCADLFLDTLPFNAGTTASDALWAGLPVLTRRGESFAGRMASSLLHAAGLPELVAETDEAYEAMALQLAREPAQLAGLKARLAEQRLSCPLFDTAQFTRHLEAAYAHMWQRHQTGQPPAAFDVPA